MQFSIRIMGSESKRCCSADRKNLLTKCQCIIHDNQFRYTTIFFSNNIPSARIERESTSAEYSIPLNEVTSSEIKDAWTPYPLSPEATFLSDQFEAKIKPAFASEILPQPFTSSLPSFPVEKETRETEITGRVKEPSGFRI